MLFVVLGLHVKVSQSVQSIFLSFLLLSLEITGASFICLHVTTASGNLVHVCIYTLYVSVCQLYDTDVKCVYDVRPEILSA